MKQYRKTPKLSPAFAHIYIKMLLSMALFLLLPTALHKSFETATRRLILNHKDRNSP